MNIQLLVVVHMDYLLHIFYVKHNIKLLYLINLQLDIIMVVHMDHQEFLEVPTNMIFIEI